MTDGFCKDEVNAFGPVHAYVAPATSGVVKFRLSPSQMGLLLDAAGVVGIGLTVTLTVPVGLVQPATVTVSEYVPDIAAVALGRVGFCNVEV